MPSAEETHASVPDDQTASPPTDRPSHSSAEKPEARPSLWQKAAAAAAAAEPSKRTTFSSYASGAATHLATIFALCASLLSSDAFATFVALVPADGKLWAAGALAAVLRVSFLAIRLLSDPSTFRSWRAAGTAALRFVATLVVNMLAVLPQPIFLSVVGGAFGSGDAGKVASLRLGRGLWRASAGGLDALTAIVAGLLAYYAIKVLPKDVPAACLYGGAAAAVTAAAGTTSTFADVERALATLLGAALAGAFGTAAVLALLAMWRAPRGAASRPAQLLSLPKEWTRAKAVVANATAVGCGVLTASLWRVVETHVYTGTLQRLSGLDVAAALAHVPTPLLLSRHEAALLQPPLALTSVPAGWALILADLLMANAALPPPAGACGSLVFGLVLWLHGLAPLPGYYLTAGSWGLLLATTYLGSGGAPGKHEVPLLGSSRAVVQLVHAKGLKAGSAGLTFTVGAGRLTRLHALLRPNKAIDVSTLVYLGVLVAMGLQLTYRQPLTGYLPGLPAGLSSAGTGTGGPMLSGWYLHPFVLVLAVPRVASMPLSLARKAWAAVWKGKALVACGVAGLPDRAVQTSIKRVEALAEGLVAAIVPPEAPAAAPAAAEAPTG